MKKIILICGLFLTMLPLFAQKYSGAIKVEIKQVDGNWTLLRGGEPYYIKGVGGQVHLDSAKAYGANSIRTWGPGEAIPNLDKAHELGMTVLFGFWVGQERQGFDYEDGRAVKAQLEGFREVVRKYKDHPAILMWGIGNENDLFYSDFKVWNAINDIAKMIHEEDPNHPTLHVTAGLEVAEVQLIQERAPHIDVYGMNTYGDIMAVDRGIRMFGWEGPYIIAEWGPTGHWEVPKTEWGASIEQTSAEKAAIYKKRYEEAIYPHRDKCLGSYAFIWGSKQETTPTWYGIFLDDGTETEVVDVLQYVWSGKWPKNRSPHLESYTINGKTAYDNIYVESGEVLDVKAVITEPDGDPLRFKWELLPESTDIKAGGDVEERPEAVKIKVSGEGGDVTLRAPAKPGPYRFFMYAYDGNGNAAVANIPFYVEE